MSCPMCGHDPGAVVIASWTMAIDREVTSLNARVGNYGPQRFAYKANRDAWQWLFRAQRLAQRIPIARGSRRAFLTRRFACRQRAYDQDNLTGGMKPIVDAMVCEGLLAGDDRQSAELHYQQERKEPRGLLVVIQDLEAGPSTGGERGAISDENEGEGEGRKPPGRVRSWQTYHGRRHSR